MFRPSGCLVVSFCNENEWCGCVLHDSIVFSLCRSVRLMAERFSSSSSLLSSRLASLMMMMWLMGCGEVSPRIRITTRSNIIIREYSVVLSVGVVGGWLLLRQCADRHDSYWSNQSFIYRISPSLFNSRYSNVELFIAYSFGAIDD